MFRPKFVLIYQLYMPYLFIEREGILGKKLLVSYRHLKGWKHINPLHGCKSIEYAASQ